jgi:DNA-directed RNA polymerase specialized sigma24 family protein
VLNNSGTTDDADDALQEAILVYIEKSRRGEITLRATPSTLIYNIASKIWLDELRKRKKWKLVSIFPDVIEDTEHLEIDRKKIQETLFELIEEQISEMKETCRLILMGRLRGESYESLADSLGIRNIFSLRVRYHRCKNELFIRMNIHKDKSDEIKDLFDHG